MSLHCRSLLRPTGDGFKEMEEPIPEKLLDVQELPLLPEEDLVMEQLDEFVPLQAPEMVSTSEDEEGKKIRKEKDRKETPRKETPSKESPRKETPRKESPRKESPKKDVPHENVLR